MKKILCRICMTKLIAGGLAVAAAILISAIPGVSAWASAIKVENATGHLIDGEANGHRVEIYMDIENGGGSDRLYAVRTDLSKKAMLSVVNKDNSQHEGHHDGMVMPETRHAETTTLEVPAGGRTRLAMGGSHIMLMNPKKLPPVGATFPVTLFFEKAGRVTVDVMMETANLALQPAE